MFRQRVDGTLPEAEFGCVRSAGSPTEAAMSDQNDWISVAADALALLGMNRLSGPRTICQRAHAGMIKARADRFIRNGQAAESSSRQSVDLHKRYGRTFGVTAACRLVVQAIATLPFLAAPAAAPRAESPREAAVLLARGGHLDQAIERLRALLASGTTDPIVPLDLAVLLQQAGNSAEAVEVYQRANPAKPPSYALLAITRAYRDLKQFDRAAELARSGMQRFPTETVWPIMLALILADQGKVREAVTTLETPAARRAPLVEHQLASAYAMRRSGRPFDALRDYEAVLLHDPVNAEARTGAIDVLRDIRAPWAAAQFAPEPPPLPLAGDMAAAEVRWGTKNVPYDSRHRFDATERALRSLDRLIAQAQAQGNADLAIRLRLDRIVALRDRVRMVEVVSEADALRNSGQNLPPYASEAVADALLYLRQPQAARSEYDKVLPADPSDRDARVGRIYASVEMEDFATAYAQADELLKSQSVWRQYKDDSTHYADDDFIDAELLDAAVRLYGDQPDEAWQRIVSERDAAPGNAFIRLGVASIMNARNWPRAAEQENQIALSLAPSLPAAQIAVADSALGRNHFAEAREQIAELADLYPENLSVQRLQRELTAQTGWELDAEFRPANEHGGGTFGNGNELAASSRIYSPLINDTWRLFASYNYANAHPPEGFVDLHRASAGLQVILPDVTANAAVTQDFGTLSRTGFTGSVDWNPTDHASLALAGEHISIETPLRALLDGVTADSVSTRFTYTWDEAHSASLGASWLPFTDGNQRETASARYTQKMISIPHFGLTVQAELYGSTNSRANTIYYNPLADGSVSVGLLAEHTLWRHYEHSLIEAVTLDGGWYGERNFKGGPVGTAAYEHRWRFAPWTELVYGVSIGERIYDGQGARVIGAFITLRQKI
jgi:biofilm PGA synthesis protein PgaA